MQDGQLPLTKTIETNSAINDAYRLLIGGMEITCVILLYVRY